MSAVRRPAPICPPTSARSSTRSRPRSARLRARPEAEIEGRPARSRGAANGRVEAAVREILDEIGEDPDRQGLLGTPERVHRMYMELTAGYHVDPERLINGAIFDVDYSEMVVVKDIPFYSLCEHHLLPFFGTAAVAYIPRGRVIGLSKIPRIVEMYARRLQVQERLTQQIADFLQERLAPQGVGVVLEATHLCAVMRGVRKPGTVMTTSRRPRPVPDPRPDPRRVLRPPRAAGPGALTRSDAATPVPTIGAMTDRPIKVLIAKPGLDGHDRGAKVLARGLRDEGFEVVYTGLRQTPEMIATAALQEDVDVVGLSILSGAHMTLLPRICDLLRERGPRRRPGHGRRDHPRRRHPGPQGGRRREVFGPGTTIGEVAEYLRANVRPRD